MVAASTGYPRGGKIFDRFMAMFLSPACGLLIRTRRHSIAWPALARTPNRNRNHNRNRFPTDYDYDYDYDYDSDYRQH
jgi:hypothetical protein